MGLEVRTGEEAQKIAAAIRDGVAQEDGSFIKLTPEQETVALGALRKYAKERQETAEFVEAQRDEDGNLPAKPKLKVFDNTVDDNGQVINDEGLSSDVLRRSGGAIQLGTTFVTGAAAEPVAGFAGLLTLAFTGDPDAAANAVTTAQDSMTFMPRTETGQEMLETIAAPIAKIEEGIDWIASNASLGNPYAATAIKTALLGAAEIYGGLKGAARVRVPRKLKEIQDQARALGIELDANNMQSSLIDAANKMTPDQRAANAGFLQSAMKQAKEASQAAVDDAFAKARQGRAYVEVESVEALSRAMAKELQEGGFDFTNSGMEDIAKRLDSLANIGTVRPGLTKQVPLTEAKRITQQFSDIELIRRQLVQDARSGTPSAQTAANKMKGMMDDWMDTQLYDNLVTGDPKVLTLWKDARIAHTDYMNNFNADRAIKNMVERGATPEEVRAWVTGMSHIGAKPQAARTIETLKNVLGKDHPAIEGIRQDMLFEAAAPLLQQKPNFSLFISNYDKMISNNPSLVKALDLNGSDLKQLRDFAVTAEKMHPNQAFMNTELLTRGLATYFVGHQLARKALKVNLVRNIGAMMFGVNRVTKRGILADLTNSTYGKPIAPRGSAAAGAFIAAAQISGAEETVRQNRELRNARIQAIAASRGRLE